MPPPSARAIPPSDGVLVRFGEIGIKSAPVRRSMLERLRRNVLDLMEREGVEGDVLRMGSRLWMVGPDATRLADVACRTFGVVSASPARRVPGTMEAICQAAAEAAVAIPGWTRFAVRARREGTHTFSSQDINIQAGSAIFKAAEAAGRKPKVDLTNPEQAVDIDVRGDQAFIFTTQLEGPGGIPMGSQGRVVALLSDEASFVAAWFMGRRGCQVIPLHAGDSGSLPAYAVAALARWGLPHDVEVLPVCTGHVAKPVLLAAAAHVAQEHRAAALVTGDTLSSTLLPAPMPVLRPVCGLDPEEYERWRSRIGLPATDYPDSILADHARETVDTLLAMRRTVTA